MVSSSMQRAVLDRVGAGAQRQRDAVVAVRVHGDLLAVQVRGLDEGAGLVLEHLLRPGRRRCGC